MLTQTIEVQCPHCGSLFDSVVDCSAGSQEYVEDCAVCCSPIVFQLSIDDRFNLTGWETRREND